MLKQVYIHYGSNSFHVPNPITNIWNFTKPSGGLWASRKDGENTWKDFCESEEFMLDSFSKSFEFVLKDNAKVLELNNLKQLANLPVISNNNTGTVYLDFEELARIYDAIEVTNISAFYYPLYGWDCNSILVTNPDIVEVVKGKEEKNDNKSFRSDTKQH